MTPAKKKSRAVLAETRSFFAGPGNDFTWSWWTDGRKGLAEFHERIAAVRAGRASKAGLVGPFAPTGPIQDVSLGTK